MGLQAVGVYFTLRLGFIQSAVSRSFIRQPFLKHRKSDRVYLSFQALVRTKTLGPPSWTATWTGVAGSFIFLGGPGAIFWDVGVAVNWHGDGLRRKYTRSAL